MKKNIFFLLLSFFYAVCSAQNDEAVYLQQEHQRLTRVDSIENVIQNFIDQNISTYNLSSGVLSKITTQTHEDGSVFTQTEINESMFRVKQQQLRDLYFSQNPSIIINYIPIPIPSTTPCINNGFEDGTTASFSFFSQPFDGNGNPLWNIYNNFPTNNVGVPSNDTGIISLISGAQMLDPVTNIIPRVKSGNHSIRLNNNSGGGYDVSLMRRDFIVQSNQDHITFNYALVLQDPQGTGSHTNTSSNPYYQCRLKTSTGNIIFERRIIADRNNTLVFNSIGDGSIVYTNWNCENMDVSQYKGQTLTLEVIVSDCGLGGHWGYAYFDDFCGTKCTAPTFGSITLNPIGITCPLLPLTVSGSFTAPAGYELQNLSLKVKDLSGQNTDKIITNYTLTGSNTFSFKVKNSDFFPNAVVSNKGFDFFVTGTFKLVGQNTTTEIISQSANAGNDVTFNTTCNICDDCKNPIAN